MIDITVKKLWNGCVSLRSNWIKIGIDNNGLSVKYKNQVMDIPKSTLEKTLQSIPSIYIKSKYDGKTYGLHDVKWIPKDGRQDELFKQREENGI